MADVFGKHQPKIPYQPIADLLAQYRRRDPDKLAIVDLDQGSSISFGALDRAVTDISAALKERGVGNGAKAALLADRIGAIEVGKEADIVLFDTDRPEWQPLINPVSNLVYSATGDSVRDVFVAGEQVVANGRLTKIDEDKLYAEIPVAVARFGKHLKFEQMVQLRWPVS